MTEMGTLIRRYLFRRGELISMRLPCILMAALLQVNVVQAEEAKFAKVFEGLNSDSSKERKSSREELVSMMAEDSTVIASVRNKSLASLDPVTRIEAKNLLELYFRKHVLNEVKLYFGFELGHFIKYKYGILRTYPLVLQVEKGSPAERAGIKPGDIFWTYEGDDCGAVDGRKKLLSKLSNIKIPRELTFTVKHYGSAKPFEDYLRTQTKVSKLTPQEPEEGEERSEFTTEEFEDWLTRI